MKSFRAVAVGLLLASVGFHLRPFASAAVFPNDDKTIAHVLNRVGFGARPGDMDAVRAIGVQKYIDQQLHPEQIPDVGVNARLTRLTTIGMSSREIAERYALPALEARRERKRETGAGLTSAPAEPQAREANRVLRELSEQKLLRAVYSERQLNEVLTDFWFNHFNVDARKGPDRFLLTEYERETIRPHVLGRFRDLLEATAKSPAMLFYLDNWMSADPQGLHLARSVVRGRRPTLPRSDGSATPAARSSTRKGLNENYGRELMELHTLGVDGGYTQKDVTEVARSFTGWTIQNPRLGGGFRFDPRLHDEAQKVVLGHVIRSGGGIEDGEQVLDILASHPSTARLIATKLVRRFVSDAPPPGFVDRVAARYRQTEGDLREVVRAILMSPEFLSPDAYRAKVKTPFEFVASALRATEADIQDAGPLVRAMQQLGMPLYQCQPPTGYQDTADAWVNTGGLVDRMNFALQIASNTLPGTKVVVGAISATQSSVRAFPGDELSESTRMTIEKATTVTEMTALTLGSPEFQRR